MVLCLIDARAQAYVPPQVKQELQKQLDRGKAWLNNATELELKVLEATNHEPWGPHGQVMNGEPVAECSIARHGAVTGRRAPCPPGWSSMQVCAQHPAAAAATGVVVGRGVCHSPHGLRQSRPDRRA